jgi:hypothetical protein
MTVAKATTSRTAMSAQMMIPMGRTLRVRERAAIAH